jgi:hypothetical protein
MGRYRFTAYQNDAQRRYLVVWDHDYARTEGDPQTHNAYRAEAIPFVSQWFVGYAVGSNSY